MYKLYFESDGKRRQLLGKRKELDEIYSLINQYISDHNYKCHYMRMWNRDSEKTKKVDFGSHTDFFYIVQCD